MYLLDTDTIVYILKGNEAVNQSLKNHLYDSIKISAVTLMELYYGAHKSQKVESNIAKVKAIENSLEVIPINPELTQTFGSLKSKLEKKGVPLDDFDLIIASTALTYNLTLISNNEKHFKRIDGLKLENWASA